MLSDGLYSGLQTRNFLLLIRKLLALKSLIELRHRNRQAADCRQSGIGFLLLLAECRHIGRRQFRRRQGHGRRVYRLAVHPSFVVQVRACGTPRGTDIADNLTALTLP